MKAFFLRITLILAAFLGLVGFLGTLWSVKSFTGESIIIGIFMSAVTFAVICSYLFWKVVSQKFGWQSKWKAYFFPLTIIGLLTFLVGFVYVVYLDEIGPPDGLTILAIIPFFFVSVFLVGSGISSLIWGYLMPSPEDVKKFFKMITILVVLVGLLTLIGILI